MKSDKPTAHSTRREHALPTLPISTVGPSVPWSVLRILLCIVALLMLYAFAQNRDAAAKQETEQQPVQQLHADVSAQRLAEVYAQGQRDAIAAMRNTPEGLELAQACMAWLRTPDTWGGHTQPPVASLPGKGA